jgi:hypothetical protein
MQKTDRAPLHLRGVGTPNSGVAARPVTGYKIEVGLNLNVRRSPAFHVLLISASCLRLCRRMRSCETSRRRRFRERAFTSFISAHTHSLVALARPSAKHQ